MLIMFSFSLRAFASFWYEFIIEQRWSVPFVREDNKLFLPDKNSLLAEVYAYEVIIDAIRIISEVSPIKSESLFSSDGSRK